MGRRCGDDIPSYPGHWFFSNMVDAEKKVYSDDKKSNDSGVVAYSSDTESQVYNAQAPGELKRQLKNRHIAMIRYVLLWLPMSLC